MQQFDTRILIREATPDDAIDVSKVFAAAFAPLRSIYRPTSEAEARQAERANEGTRLVAEINQQIVGTVQFASHTKHVHVIGLAVHPDFQRRGVARRMIEWIVTRFAISVVPLLLICSSTLAQDRQQDATTPFLTGNFRWRSSEPLLAVNPERLPPSPDNPWHAVKDPSVIRYQDRWHLFCTLRKLKGGDGKPPGYIRIGHVSFANWEDANDAHWHLLELSMGYHGAPQVYYFTPHKKWYLIYQLEDSTRDIAFGPCYSTTEDINDSTSWSLPTPLYSKKPDNLKGWLDFWVICDQEKAHLFFTSLDGRMWRAETQLTEFPRGFGRPEVVIQGDIFEASHTYRVKGLDKYLTLVEAQGRSGGKGRRYYKAYVADSLAGKWSALAATGDKPFAGGVNVELAESKWTDSFSHGELIRSGYDERLEVAPDNLRLLFQGLGDEDWGSSYGQLGWRLGLLESVQE